MFVVIKTLSRLAHNDSFVAVIAYLAAHFLTTYFPQGPGKFSPDVYAAASIHPDYTYIRVYACA